MKNNGNTRQFREEVKRQAMQQGLTLTELALEMGVTKGYLSRFLNEQESMTRKSIDRMRDFLPDLDIRYWQIHFGNYPHEFLTFTKANTDDVVEIIDTLVT